MRGDRGRRQVDAGLGGYVGLELDDGVPAMHCADGDGYRVDRYGFHLEGPALDCSHGNARRHRNLDMTKIDDLDRALAILEVFVEAHPLTEVESAKLRAYRMQQSAWRAQGIEFDDFDDLDDLDEDEGWTS